MKTSEYHQRVETFFNQLVDAIDSAGADIDCEQAGGILTLVMADKSRIILNKQEPLHQIWVATRENGYHFDWKDGKWIDNRGGRELIELLSDACSKQSGEKVTLG